MAYEQINVHKSVSPKIVQEKFCVFGETCNLKFSISNNGLHLDLITEFNIISIPYIYCVFYDTQKKKAMRDKIKLNS